jgi:hypothetical protein
MGVPNVSMRIRQVRSVALVIIVSAWSAAVGSRSDTAFAAQAAPQGQPVRAIATSPASHTDRQAVLERYCLTCHTQRAKERGTVPIALDGLNVSSVANEAPVWERVVLKMRAGVMPPAGMPRPDKAAHEAFVSFVEGELDRAASARPNPGRTEPFHRLNRTEYQNAVRDLLGLDLDVSSLLPPDDSSYGFDNIAGVLKISPTLLERYLTAAQKVSRLAVGTPSLTPSIDYFRVADDLSQDRHVSGLPLGSRGGTRIRYVFPVDADYEFRVRLARDLNEGVPLYPEAQDVEVSVDGVRVGRFTLPGVGRPAARPPAPAAPEVSDSAAPAPRSAPATPGPAAQATGPSAGRGAGAPGAPATGSTAAPPAPQRTISQIATGPRLSGREREARNRADESWNVRVPVAAGQRDVIVTFLNPTAALEETPRLPFLRPYPAGVNIPETRLGAHLRSVEIAGPLDARSSEDRSAEERGAGERSARESDARQRIFTCRPTAPAQEAACATRILTSLARRAYRRPVTASDVQPLLAFYREGRTQGGSAGFSTAAFDLGIERALRRLLVSPEFLFRVERDPVGAAAGAPYRISDIELASRLSFFLWSSIPDDELLNAAVSRQLGRPAALAQQVRRMLADPRAEAFVRNFAGQWLFLRNLQAVVPVQSVFPDFDDGLRQSFLRETELFFESIVREDRSALDLLRADYTFVNERLARHYGIPGVKGTHFRRIALGADHPRKGLLGHGSLLTVTSYPDRTSPVVRGKWILENLLGTPPPAPPPNVPVLRATSSGGVVLSMRQRMEQHRANPVCASCHATMDPLGLSLENFDAVGKWRTLGEASAPVDATGMLPDGTRFEGPAGLRDALLRSDRFVATVTEKLMTYALGRGLEYYDAPAVRAVLREAAPSQYQFSALIAAVVQSGPFRMRQAAAPPQSTLTNTARAEVAVRPLSAGAGTK